MFQYGAHLHLVDNIREAERQVRQAEFPAFIRPKVNPLDLSDEIFIKNFRISKHQFEQLENLIGPYIREPYKRTDTSKRMKVPI